MSRSTSSGDEDGYGALTHMLDDEKLGRNSSGSRWSDKYPSTKIPITAIVIVTRRSTANLAMGFTWSLSVNANLLDAYAWRRTQQASRSKRVRCSSVRCSRMSSRNC